jgi:S1-C subfamily serine protease
MVAELHPDSPFVAAGLAAGDVILALDTLPVQTPPEVDFRIAVAGQGADLPVLYLRDGRAQEAVVALTAPPEPPAETVTVTGDVPLRGLSVSRLPRQLAVQMDLPPDLPAVVVIDVRDRAARAGLLPGDLVLAINGIEVSDPAQVPVLAAVGRLSRSVDILRDGEVLRLRLRF